MENDRSLKVDVAVNGYRDEDGKYNILSHDVSIPKEKRMDKDVDYTKGFKEELDSSVVVSGGIDQDGKRILISEAAIGKPLDVEVAFSLGADTLGADTEKPKSIRVEEISEVLSGDMSDDTIITTPKGVVKTAGEIRDEARNFTYENSPLANKVKSKRVEAVEFLTKKDSKRYDFKALLRDCLKGYKHSVETIRAIYKIRVLNKAFKHLNANSKRIALNDYLSNKFIEHSAETNESTIDLIALLKNDNNLIDYAVLLKRVLVMAINRNIKLY